MKYKILVTIAVSLILNSFSTMAKNPGESAIKCIRVSKKDSDYNNLEFKNTCGYKVFVVWCGDLKHKKETCGTGKNFFNNAVTLEGYKSKETTLKQGGKYLYAACKGSLGYDSSKAILHPSSDKGRFTCI